MISIQEWQRRGDRFLFAGHEIFCNEQGEAESPVLLLIHGFPTASWDWQYLWDPLSVTHRVLTLDMLGFGLSDKPSQFDYSIVKQADLLTAFLQDRNVTSYHILAHDYGDSVAQELLARHIADIDGPGIVSICFLNGGLFPESHQPLFAQRMMLSRLGPLMAKMATFKTFAAQFKKICGCEISPEDLQSLWTLVCHNDGLNVMPKLSRYMLERKQQRDRWVEALVSSKIPMRLIDGVLDPVSGAQMVARYRELVPNADVVELADVGHYPQLEKPDAVLSAAFDFWRRF